MKTVNLQDAFLNQARREKVLVTIYLTNGFQFKGLVKGFDNFTVVLDCEGRQNLVYKHAISPLFPRNVSRCRNQSKSNVVSGRIKESFR